MQQTCITGIFQQHRQFNCAACHTVAGWEQATFDHTQTNFPLLGKHVGVDCRDCHADGVFRGTPQDCYARHSEPAFHVGLLGDDCAICHTADGWLPAGYNRPHIFPFDHGERGSSPCRTCHPDTLQTYTCYTCHEHDPAEIEREHREEGIGDFQNCGECHPTGREDEAEGDDD